MRHIKRLWRLIKSQNKRYTSDIQQVLDQFDRQTPLSDSQKAEINKHAAIFDKRDNQPKQADKNTESET